MIQPPNYGALIGAGQQLVPDMLQQELQRRLAAVQEQQAETQTNQETRLRAGYDHERGRERELGERLRILRRNPTAKGYADLIGEFHEYHEPLRRSLEAWDKDRLQSENNALGSMFSAGAAGKWDVAANVLRERIAATRAGNQPVDPEDDEILKMLETDDELIRRDALGMIGYQFAVINGPERLAPMLNALRPVMGPSDAETYARSLGYKPGTADWKAALEDYVLRSSGPSAHERDVELEEGRQENRVELEGVRVSGRSQLEEQRQGNRVELEGARQGNRVQLEGVRQGGRERLEGTRENNRRTRPPSTLIERLRGKVAAGQQLSPGEQRVWDSYQRSNTRGRAGRNGGGNAARGVLNGRAIVVRGNRWVYEDTGQPAQ